jgi:hypothetical protein
MRQFRRALVRLRLDPSRRAPTAALGTERDADVAFATIFGPVRLTMPRVVAPSTTQRQYLPPVDDSLAVSTGSSKSSPVR